MPSMAKSTQDRYKGVIKNYLIPAYGELSLRDLSRLTIQRYFSEMANSPLAHESKDKIKDVLSSILGSAVEFELLAKNPRREHSSAGAKNRPQTNQAVHHSQTVRRASGEHSRAICVDDLRRRVHRTAGQRTGRTEME
jgi:Phage integrase, N-terminal SAM-like domain